MGEEHAQVRLTSNTWPSGASCSMLSSAHAVAVPGDRIHQLLRILLDSPEEFLRFLRALLGGLDAVIVWAEGAGEGDGPAPWGIGGDGRRGRHALPAGAFIADAFWRLFNRPAAIALLRQLAPATAARDESAYWRLVLRYCRQGNLQAVLDEQWHMLWDQESWSEDASADETAARCARKLVQVVHPARARVHGQFFRAERGVSGGSVEREELRVRTVFALRASAISARTTASTSARTPSAPRLNSLLRPFVLASTSIGQEGLDFHPWCHRLIHWTLPGNPVDLEQREGPIHRYKGHAVRRNVAASHADDAFEAWRAGDDVWALMFELADKAARAADESDLVRHWIALGEHRVERHVPQLPYTSEIEAFDRLKRQLAASIGSSLGSRGRRS